MADNRNRKPGTVVDTIVKKEEPLIDFDFSASNRDLATLRERWELASVLNFFIVFEQVIGSDLKMSAEEIEMGLINPDSSLAKLHITLLKGIPPVSKDLNSLDSWVPALRKKLAPWWPWVAEGKIPLSEAKGEETSRYKELDPTTRLLILKALCEIRADQNDAASYINDALKSGTEIPCFRKDKIGNDGNGTTYWCDGNSKIGYRLYKEVLTIRSKAYGSKSCLTPPNFNFRWETLATNLEEFQKIVDEFSSRTLLEELAAVKTIQADIIPILELIRKKKEMAMKKKQRRAMQLNGPQKTYAVGITRSCRLRKPVSYTYDEYDRVIEDAINETKKRKTSKEQTHGGKLKESGNSNGKASNENLDSDLHSEDDCDEKHTITENGTDSNSLHGGNASDKSDGDYLEKEDDDESESSHSEKENNNLVEGPVTHKHFGSRWSSRLTSANGNHVADTRNLVTKNRSRQRPTRNTAIESSVVPDSVDENSENTVSGEEESVSQDTGDDEENSDR